MISYYRIDENGHTYIALKENTKAFKFTNLDQLRQLNISVPEQIYNEIYQRKQKIAELEAQAASSTLQRASEPRIINSNQHTSKTQVQSQYQQLPPSDVHNPPNPQVIPPRGLETTGYSTGLNQSTSKALPVQTQASGRFKHGAEGYHNSFVQPPVFRFPNCNQSRRNSEKRGRSSSSSPTAYTSSTLPSSVSQDSNHYPQQ